MSPKNTPKRKKFYSTEIERAEARRYFGANYLLVNPPVKRAAYSDRMAWVLASMAQLVYQKFEHGGREKELLLETLAGGGFKWINEFVSRETDTQAFLVVKDDMSYAVLAFRGTEPTKLTDVLTDARASLVSAIAGRVHRGFMHAYRSVEKDIERNLARLKDIPIYITGHSLGAALATLATQCLEQNDAFRDQIAACYTFGSPRVGNKEFDKDLKSVVYRVINTTDIVTVIPLLVMGYIHVGDIRFLENLPGVYRRGYIPLLHRSYFFLLTGMKWFAPLVGDHAIEQYRKKLEAVAQDRNVNLYFAGDPETKQQI
jgi:triacylglycerol lipase